MKSAGIYLFNNDALFYSNYFKIFLNFSVIERGQSPR